MKRASFLHHWNSQMTLWWGRFSTPLYIFSSQRCVNEQEPSAWGFAGSRIKTGDKRREIIKIHSAEQWAAFQRRVPFSMRQTNNKEALTNNHAVSMVPSMGKCFNFTSLSLQSLKLFIDFLIIARKEEKMCQI